MNYGYDESWVRVLANDFRMSTYPTRVDSDTARIADDPGLAVHAGNRALESIGRHEALRSLLAFSELHERIRTRRALAHRVPDDLFQTERFVLDEVLQLICDRALAVTGAHGIMVALAEGSAILCRASSGSIVVERGARIPIDSQFLAECLVSGQVVRCDDAESDQRVALDLVRQAGATSSVLVPLRGSNARLGVLQAFSRIPFGFTDNDVRSLDLFAELVLSALKPEDQDRRINWLADLATEVLTPKPAAAERGSVELAVPELVATTSSSSPPPVEEIRAAEFPPAPTSLAVDKTPSAPKSKEPRAESSTDTPVLTLLPFDKPVSQEEKNHDAHGLWELVSSRPGLSIVIALVAVAALFSGGVWLGMHVHRPAPARWLGASDSLTTRRAPSVSGPDNLMDPARFAPQSTSSTSNDKPFPKITEVRHWSSAVGSTVVVDMEDEAPYEVHRLMAPERIYFDLHDTTLAPSLDGQTINVGDAALSRIRIAQPVAGVTRLVLDTREGANFSVSMETNPYRLVIELRSNEQLLADEQPRAEHKSVATSTALSQAPPKPTDERLAARTGKFRIVLDAGHGGWDLGTVGRNGLVEKDLVLDVTQRLGKLLQSRLGADVVFTRTTDDYLSLDERAELANQSQADLFVSVHANYSNSANARGVETYYSNFFAAPGSKEIEKRENGGTVNPVTVSLSASSLQDKIEQSRHLASNVQRALYAALAPKNPDIRDRGIKDAAFVVLTGTTMPAILTEISFVSSPADEHNLQSEAYRQKIAEALYKGITRYQESAQHEKVAQLQATSGR